MSRDARTRIVAEAAIATVRQLLPKTAAGMLEMFVWLTHPPEHVAREMADLGLVPLTEEQARSVVQMPGFPNEKTMLYAIGLVLQNTHAARQPYVGPHRSEEDLT